MKLCLPSGGPAGSRLGISPSRWDPDWDQDLWVGSRLGLGSSSTVSTLPLGCGSVGLEMRGSTDRGWGWGGLRGRNSQSESNPEKKPQKNCFEFWQLQLSSCSKMPFDSPTIVQMEARSEKTPSRVLLLVPMATGGPEQQQKPDCNQRCRTGFPKEPRTDRNSLSCLCRRQRL